MNTKNETSQKNDSIVMVIRMKGVIQMTGLSNASIRRKIKDNSFPIPIKLGSRAIGWYIHEIEEYLLSLPRLKL